MEILSDAAVFVFCVVSILLIWVVYLVLNEIIVEKLKTGWVQDIFGTALSFFILMSFGYIVFFHASVFFGGVLLILAIFLVFKVLKLGMAVLVGR